MCPVCLQQFIATRSTEEEIAPIPLTALPAIDARPSEAAPPSGSSLVPAAEHEILHSSPEQSRFCCSCGDFFATIPVVTNPIVALIYVRGMDSSRNLTWLPGPQMVAPGVQYETEAGSSESGEVHWVSVINPGGVQWWVRSDDLQLLLDLQHLSAEQLTTMAIPLKVRLVRHQLVSLLTPAGTTPGGSTIRLELRRNQMAEDLHFFFLAMLPADFIKELRFRLKNETDFFQDVGGVTREIYTISAKQIFSQDQGLWNVVSNGQDAGCYMINPETSSVDQSTLERFQFSGRMLAKALLDGYTVPVPLTTALYQQILKRRIGLEELLAQDPEMHQSMVWMLQNDVQDFDQTFTITEAGPLGTVERELCKEGKELAVTEVNKAQFVQMRVAWHLMGNIEMQLQAFLSGVYDVLPNLPALASCMQPAELRKLWCGTQEIDVNDWSESTLYSAPCSATDPVVQWFWESVRAMPNPLRARLLYFVTGSSCVPVEGFAGLASVHGKCYPFSISTIPMARTGWSLPRAHTCFNRLDLPKYGSKQQLEDNLMRVLEDDTMGFGMDE